jgi:NAD(P)-dependent dehydrogenase (short-subunit alcohol dehydrogenase family)
MTTTSIGADWLTLQDRVCVVTGAGGGIGRATATVLAAAGARLALLDRDRATCAATAQSLSADAIAIDCDVSDPASVAAAADQVARRFGACDVLVNNAGLLRPGPLKDIAPAEWSGLLAVNLTGCFLCAQAFGRAMLERKRGSIVHVASIAASHPQPFSGAYSVSKAGIVMLSQQLAVEWGPSGVRSNVVSPGLVRTPLSEAFYQTPGVTERRAATIPLRRIATPDDMAQVIAFLASDRSAYVTGQEIIVDGGFGRVLMELVPRPGYDRGDHAS